MTKSNTTLWTRLFPGRPFVGEVGHPVPQMLVSQATPITSSSVYQGRGRRPPPPPTCDLMREMKKGRPRERREGRKVERRRILGVKNGKTAELNFVALEEKGGGDLTGRKNATNYTRVERERTIRRRRRRQQMAKKLNAHHFCTSKETQGAPVKNGTCIRMFHPT